jgi:hypothetical protein
MSWIRDLTGKVVTYLGSTMPDRRNLIIRGTGVTVTDDPAQEATVLDFSAGGGTGGSVEQIDVSGGLTVGSPTGPVVSISASSLQGQLVNLSNDVDAAEQSIADLESLDAGNRLNTLETEQTDQGNRITLVERGTFTITSTGIVNISNSAVGKTVIVNTSAETNLLLSESGIDIGSKFRVIRAGTGEVSLSGTGSTSVERSRFTTSQLAGQNSKVEVVKIAANTWVMNGDLKEEKPLVTTFFEEGQQRSTGDYLTFTTTGGMQLKGGFTLQSNDRFTVPVDGFYRVSFSIYMRNTNSGTGDPDPVHV